MLGMSLIMASVAPRLLPTPIDAGCGWLERAGRLFAFQGMRTVAVLGQVSCVWLRL